jgi:hypothetical protein
MTLPERHKPHHKSPSLANLNSVNQSIKPGVKENNAAATTHNPSPQPCHFH